MVCELTNLPSISWLKLDVVAIVHKQTEIIIVPVSYFTIEDCGLVFCIV